MPLTFAYGSNMDAEQMRTRCPGARRIGRARLPKFRVALMPDGFATLARDPASTAQGVLWELGFADLAALDRYEGVAQGAYTKSTLPVLREKAGAIRALVYFGQPEASPGRAPADYMERIVAAARDNGLPSDYLDFLRLLGGLPSEAPPKFRAIKNNRSL